MAKHFEKYNYNKIEHIGTKAYYIAFCLKWDKTSLEEG